MLCRLSPGQGPAILVPYFEDRLWEEWTEYRILRNGLGIYHTHLRISDGVILDNSIRRHKDVSKELCHIVFGQV